MQKLVIYSCNNSSYCQNVRKLAETLQKYHLRFVEDKTLLSHVGAVDDQTTLDAAGVSFGQTSKFNYLGSVISVADGVMKINLVKAKRQLIHIFSFLISTPLGTKLVKMDTIPT